MISDYFLGDSENVLVLTVAGMRNNVLAPLTLPWPSKQEILIECKIDHRTTRTTVIIPLLVLLAHLNTIYAQLQPSDVRKKALLNGMEVFFLPPGEPGTVHFGLMIKNGAAFDPLEKGGTTNLMVQMLLRGDTTRRNATLLDRDLGEMGAHIEARVEWDAIFFTGYSRTAHLTDALTALAERIVRPKLSLEVLEQEKKRVVEFLNGANNLNRATQEILRREVFQGNPYGRSIEGTFETLERITLTDIKIQYRRLLMPNNAQLAVSYTDADNRLFLEMGRPWGGWVRSDSMPFTFRQARPPVGRRVILIDTPGTETVLRFGATAAAMGNRECYALEVLEQYLTLSMTDWSQEVEDSTQIRGSAGFKAMQMPGLFQVNLQVPNRELGAYMRKVEQSLGRLRSDEIDLDLYKEAKELAFLQFKQPFGLPQGRIAEILGANLYGMGLSHIMHYGLRLDRVHPRHMGSAAREFLSAESLLLVSAGPAQEIEPVLRLFGPVEILK
jgi:hypothetical protein